MIDKKIGHQIRSDNSPVSSSNIFFDRSTRFDVTAYRRTWLCSVKFYFHNCFLCIHRNTIETISSEPMDYLTLEQRAPPGTSVHCDKNKYPA